MYAAEHAHVEAVKALVAADPDPAHIDMKVSTAVYTVYHLYYFLSFPSPPFLHHTHTHHIPSF